MQQKADPQDFEKRFLECDDKFNTIFKRTSAASKIIGPDLTILKVNDALTELMGYSASEIEGTKIMEHACEQYRKHWHELQVELWSNEVPFFKLQVCLYKKDKSLIWVNVTTILFKDQGETFGFTVLDDITGLKHFEESERRLNMALKYSKMAVWELILKDKTVYRSEGHDEIFGFDKQQPHWTLDSYLPLLWDEDRPKFISAIQSLEESKAVDLQLRLKTLDGSVKWVNFQGKKEDDGAGNSGRILGTIADITRDKLVERHKDDFISIASHELKTPITSLKTSLQLLDRMKDGLAERIKALIDQANRSVDKMVVLVDDLLNASKTYKDQLKPTDAHMAYVHQGILYNIESGADTGNNNTHFISYFVLDKRNSTVTRTFLRTASASDRHKLLMHEKCHMAITFIYHKRLQCAISMHKFSGNIFSEVDSIYKSIMKELKEVNIEYDAETNHSMDRSAQTSWENKLLLQLNLFYKEKTDFFAPFKCSLNTSNSLMKANDPSTFDYSNAKKAFELTFNDSDFNWLNDKGDTAKSIQLKNGKLVIDARESQETVGIELKDQIDYNRDFEINLYFKVVAANKKNEMAGRFYWGTDSTGEGTSIGMATKSVSITFCHGGDHRKDKIESIFPDNYDALENYYLLSIRKTRNKYAVFLNGWLVKEYKFIPLPGKGMYFCTYNPGAIAYDYLKVYYLN